MSRPVNENLIKQIVDEINEQKAWKNEKYVDHTETSVESRIASKLREAIVELSQANDISVNQGAIIFVVNCLLPKVLFSLKTNQKLTFSASEGAIRVNEVFVISVESGKVAVALATHDGKDNGGGYISLDGDRVIGISTLNNKAEARFEITYTHRGLIRSYCISKKIFDPPKNYYYGFGGKEVKILNEVTRSVESTEYKATQCIKIGEDKKYKEDIGCTVLNEVIMNIVPPIPHLTNSPYKEGFYYLLSDETVGISFPEQYSAARALIEKNRRRPH